MFIMTSISNFNIVALLRHVDYIHKGYYVCNYSNKVIKNNPCVGIFRVLIPAVTFFSRSCLSISLTGTRTFFLMIK